MSVTTNVNTKESVLLIAYKESNVKLPITHSPMVRKLLPDKAKEMYEGDVDLSFRFDLKKNKFELGGDFCDGYGPDFFSTPKDTSDIVAWFINATEADLIECFANHGLLFNDALSLYMYERRAVMNEYLLQVFNNFVLPALKRQKEKEEV